MFKWYDHCTVLQPVYFFELELHGLPKILLSLERIIWYLLVAISYNLYGTAGMDPMAPGGPLVLAETLPLMYTTSSDYGVVILLCIMLVISITPLFLLQYQLIVIWVLHSIYTKEGHM